MYCTIYTDMHISNISTVNFSKTCYVLQKLTPLRNNQSAQLTYIVRIFNDVRSAPHHYVFVEFRFVYCTTI